MTDLHERMLGAMARTRVEREKPAAVLRAIGEAGYVVIERGRWERVLAVALKGDGMYMVDFEMEPGDFDDLDPVDPGAEG